jgi:hypothetical protein
MRLELAVASLFIFIAIPTMSAQKEIDFDAAFRCLGTGATWSFLPHKEEQREWVVVVVGTNAAISSIKGPINVGSINFPKPYPVNMDCLNLLDLMKSTPAQWNHFVERLAGSVEAKSLQVFAFKVAKPEGKQGSVAPKFQVPLSHEDVKKMLLRQ